MRTFFIALLASSALVACGQPSTPANDIAPAYSQADIESTTTALNDWFETKY